MEEAGDDRRDRQGDLGRDLASGTGAASVPEDTPGEAAAPISDGRIAAPSSSQESEERRAAQAALSLEISRLVARVMRGEPLNTAASGAVLARQFPDAGMSGDMIAQAIENAAGMVGMIRGDDPRAAAASSPDRPARAMPHQPAEMSGASPFEAVETQTRPIMEEPEDRQDEGVLPSRLPAGLGTMARGAATVVRRALFRGRGT